MKIIALIMLAVLVLDLAIATVFLRSVSLALLFVVSLTIFIASIRRLSRRQESTNKRGWRIGRALELSNPDQPTLYPDATIEPGVLNLGMLVIGSPGAGKTESVELGYVYSLPSHSPGSGWAFFEGKGDIDIYKKCVAMGSRPTHFFSSELPGSESINLFAGEPHDVIDRICKILIGETLSTSFYMDEQRAVLARIIPVLLKLRAPANLRDLYVVLSVDDAGAEVLRRAQDANVDATEISLARQWLSQPLSTRVKNIAGLLNRLFIFVSGPYADRLNAYQPDIDISRIISAGESIYLHLPLTNFSRDVAIAIIETLGVEARKRQLAGTAGLKTFPLLFDDWGAFFHDGFGPFSARCRSAAMPLSFGFQSRAQLNAVNHTYADELDDTIATKIIMRVQGDATADYAARLLGQYEAQEVSTSQFGERQGSSLSVGQKYRIDSRQLRELQQGEAFVSTLIVTPEKTFNPLWRVRFPLPNFKDWATVPMPAARAHMEGEGLSLWTRYMNPTRLAEIHAEVAAAAAVATTKSTATRASTRETERARIADNPGLDLTLGTE